jgi:hypothetical protein
MRTIARLFQIVGMGLVFIALLYGFGFVTGKGEMGKEMTYAAIGAVIFFGGRLLEKQSKRLR